MKRTNVAYPVRVLLLTLLLLFSSMAAFAQAVSGTLLGTVTDPSGAAVAGAKVNFTHTATGLTRAIVSDESGEYVAPNLPTGAYTIVIEANGFKKTTMPNVQLGVDQKVRVDVKLEIGAASESVEVQGGGAALVQTDSSDLSGTINQQQIVNLPLNGRNFVQLTRTLPGVLRGIPGANIDGAVGHLSFSPVSELFFADQLCGRSAFKHYCTR